MIPKRRAILLATLCSACGGAGPYGYAPRYVELDDEGTVVAGAVPYESVTRSGAVAPRTAQGKPIVLFGIVEDRQVGPSGRTLLKLSIRALEPSNVCRTPGDDATCRVTIGSADFGVVWAVVSLRGEDDLGPRAVGLQSLLRVVGTVDSDVSRTDGAPVVQATWYRHWPSFYYAIRK